MHAGFIFVVKNESLRLVPRCIVRKANDRLVRLPRVCNGFSIAGRQGLIQPPLNGFRHVHALLVHCLHQGVYLIRKREVLSRTQETPSAQQKVLAVHRSPPKRFSE